MPTQRSSSNGQSNFTNEVADKVERSRFKIKTFFLTIYKSEFNCIKHDIKLRESYARSSFEDLWCSRLSSYSTLAEFHVRHTIGIGTFGRVKLAQHLRTGAPFAFKILEKTKILMKDEIQQTLNEKNILSEIRHPNIVKLYSTFTCPVNCYLVLEYVPGGDLFTELEHQGCFSSETARFYIASVVLALEHLHAKGIIHRDLKPSNFLLDKRGYLKLTDFGFAKKVKERTFSSCGTPAYAAPEVISNRGHDHMADWWSLGVVLFQLLTGSLPFCIPSSTSMETYRRILITKPMIPPFLSEVERRLISCLLEKSPEKRLGTSGGAEEIKSHPWFAGFDWQALAAGTLEAPLKIELEGSIDHKYFDKYSEGENTKIATLNNSLETVWNPETIVCPLSI